MAKNKNWIITLSEDQPISEVQKQLTEKDFTVDLVLDQIGFITGFASDEVAAQVRNIPGVEDISLDISLNISSFDGSNTW